MRQATIAGIDCLAMMEEEWEQIKRKGGGIEEVYSWTGRCRIPPPHNERFIDAAVKLESVTYRGPLKREGGRVDQVEGQVMIKPAFGAGEMVRTGAADHVEAAGTGHDLFELAGTGEPAVVEDE